LDDTEQHISEVGLANSAAVLQPTGTVMVSRTASIGFACRIGRPMATTQAFATWTPGPSVDSRYLLLVTKALAPEFDRLAYGSTHLTIYMPDIESLRMPLPPVATQRAIADFLDHETAQVDALLAAKQRMVALLDERFKAQLTELLFARPNRDLASLARLCSCLPGYAFPSTEFLDSDIDATRLLRGINVTPGGVRWDEAVYFPNSRIDPRLAVYLLRPGDLVIGMDRPVVQSGMRVAAVQNADVPALLVQRVARLRANTRSTNRYLRYVLMSSAFADYFSPITTGVSVPHISEEQILGFKVPVLTLDEQAVAVAALEAAESKLVRLRTALQDQCDALDEHRQAAITSAVTGRLDIPGAA